MQRGEGGGRTVEEGEEEQGEAGRRVGRSQQRQGVWQVGNEREWEVGRGSENVQNQKLLQQKHQQR